MATDLSNWEQSSSDVNVYNRKSSVSIDHEKRRNAKRQDIIVQTNISNGSYTVFATGIKQLGLQGVTSGQDIEIFSYDAKNNKYSIKNSVYMDALFNDKLEGNDRTKFFEFFNSKIRIDTYNIAKSKSDTAIGESRLETIEKYKGYQSAKNQSTQSPQTITNGAKSNNNSNSSSTSPRSSTKQQLRSKPNTDILTPPDNKAFSLQPTQLSSTNDISGFNYMRYPEGRIPNLGYDYIQITAYKYEPVGVPAAYNDQTRESAESRLYKNPGDVIQFPMTGSISETNAVNWTDDTVNEINNIAAGIAYNAIGGTESPLEALGKAGIDAVTSLQGALTNTEAKKAIVAYFAGQAASVPNIVQRTQGKMINNNLELLFNGPSLRSFNFSFQLRPRTKSEASLIRAIIRSLKKNSAPVRSPDFLFLETPKIFRIQYIYNTGARDLADDAAVLSNDTEHPYMNKIKPCALTGLNVNYTPEGSYMTYEDGGSMTGYDLNLTFKEIEPIYADDHELTSSESMGY